MSYAARLSRQRRYDLCHCWGGWPSGLVGYRLRRRMPYIVALRGSDVPGYNERLRWLDPLLLQHVARRVWSQAARVVAVSRNLRDLALQTQPRAVIDVIPNGVDVRRFTPADHEHVKRLLFVGRLIERKGVHVLLEAFRGVRAAIPDAELTIVGDGPERARLEAMAGELALSGVAFRGHLAGDDLPAAYRESAILVLPANAEAMPNVVLEAMAAGLAIVTTPTGGSEVLRGNGVVVPHADPVALRDALVAYLTDPGLGRRAWSHLAPAGRRPVLGCRHPLLLGDLPRGGDRPGAAIGHSGARVRAQCALIPAGRRVRTAGSSVQESRTSAPGP